MSATQHVSSIVESLKRKSSIYRKESAAMTERAAVLYKESEQMALDALDLEALLPKPETVDNMAALTPVTSVADFGINESVKLRLSGEAGTVIGIASFKRSPMSYQVEYLGSDGRQSQDWFDADSLLRA